MESLRTASELLKNRTSADGADATAVRQIQGRVAELLAASRDSSVVHQAFWLNAVIEDVFYNLFGDTPYNEATEQARRAVCGDFETLFVRLADSLSEDHKEQQLTCWESFVNTYVQRIRDLNAAYLRSET